MDNDDDDDDDVDDDDDCDRDWVKINGRNPSIEEHKLHRSVNING